ncbi:MAG: UvrD-helicase domain-containing protein [Deinococcales bacterium]
MTRAGEGLLPAQARAATHPGSVAVVAGAGTGKTHMLAHRYLHHLQSGLRPLEIVAVTFTERAAAELRARIRELVAHAMNDRPEVWAELEAAQISTLHALAGRICRDHPEAAGVPPDFSVLDELEGQVWLAERLDEALAELPAAVFEELAYADVRAALHTLIQAPVDADAAFARGPEAWPERVAAARTAALRQLVETPDWREAAAVVSGSAGEPADKAEVARAAAADALHRVAAGDVGAGLAGLAAVNLQGGRRAAWPEGDLAAVKQALRTLREAARGALAEGLVDLRLGAADTRLAALMPALRGAFGRVRDALAEEKRRHRVLDFADLEVHALRALETDGVRAHYEARWKAVLVDEYQDTNAVQERVLELLGAGMTFTVVGDEKQSIYGFRGADVRVFRRRRERVRQDPAGAEIFMDRSFRAHRALTEAVNRTFAPILGELHQPLSAERTEAPNGGPPLSLQLLSDGGSKNRRQVAEARRIAATLRRLLDAGTPVWDKAAGKPRPVRPDDIAVLTRTWQPLGVYGEILPALGVPAVHTGGGNLLATREAKDALAMLRFLADPRDDLALAAVLRGPFFAVDDPTLYRFARALPPVRDAAARRAGRRTLGWWPALDALGHPPAGLDRARDVLRELLSVPTWSASRRLQLADTLTGYTAVLSGMPGASRRLADWTGFLELVRMLESGLGDAFSVVRRLRRLLRAAVDVPRPTLQADGAVSLLTIHRSKGLEWPVVVVADLEHGGRSSAPAMLYDRDEGVAFALRDEGGERAEPALYRLLGAQARRREEAEDRRVLYVALTRARDLLLLSATGDRRGAIEVLRPALEAAGIEAEVATSDAADAAYPAPPQPGAALAGPAPLTWSSEARERLGLRGPPKRPLAGATSRAGADAILDGSEAAWRQALEVLASAEEEWLAVAAALRAAGAPPPAGDLIARR